MVINPDQFEVLERLHKAWGDGAGDSDSGGAAVEVEGTLLGEEPELSLIGVAAVGVWGADVGDQSGVGAE